MSAFLHHSEYLATLHSSGGEAMQREVRDIMRPGVVVIVEDASLRHAYRAMVSHAVHALLVVGQKGPVGWVTASGLLGWVDADETVTPVRNAITQPPVSISPSATARDAVAALSKAGVSHLLVQSSPERLPEGVVTDIDLVALGRG